MKSDLLNDESDDLSQLAMDDEINDITWGSINCHFIQQDSWLSKTSRIGDSITHMPSKLFQQGVGLWEINNIPTCISSWKDGDCETR